MKELASFFDNKIMPKAKEICECPDVDGSSKYYISRAIWYINHDLADERNPIIRILPVRGVLNDERFYSAVYGTSNEATRLLRELGKLAKEFVELCQEMKE